MRALRHVSVSEFHELAWTQWAYNVLGCGPAGNSPAGYRTACSMTFVVILFLFTCVHFTYSAIMYLYFIERTHNADRGKYSQMCVDIRIRHKHWHTQTHKEWKILNLESFDKSLRCCWRLCMPQCIHSCSLSLSPSPSLPDTHIHTDSYTHAFMFMAEVDWGCDREWETGSGTGGESMRTETERGLDRLCLLMLRTRRSVTMPLTDYNPRDSLKPVTMETSNQGGKC